MIPAFRSLDRISSAGEPLPGVWSTLTKAQITFRRGELAMIAGPPGGGKSTLALQYAVQAKVPGTVYVSCDMGQHMSSVKVGSILSGRPNEEMEREGKEELRGRIARDAPHLWLCHENNPSLSDLDEIVQGLVEVRGCPPPALLIDNLKDVAAPGESRWQKDQKSCEVLKQMALKYETAIIVLAHAKVGRRAGHPASMSELKGQVSDDPAVILTVAGDSASRVLRVAAVKNRHGMPSPDADVTYELDFDGPSGVLSDPRPRSSWGYPSYEQDD